MRKWILALAPVVIASAANAAIVQYQFSTEYTGATAPLGTNPWMTVTLDDGGSAGSVTMTVDAANLINSEFVSKLLLNLDPALNPASLSFSAPVKVGVFGDPAFSAGLNNKNGGGGANFDVLVDFDTAPPVDRFGGGDKLTTVISGIPTLTANSFSFNSTGNNSVAIAAHVQGIGASGQFSGWVTTLVPEPASLSLLGLGALILRRRA